MSALRRYAEGVRSIGSVLGVIVFLFVFGLAPMWLALLAMLLLDLDGPAVAVIALVSTLASVANTYGLLDAVLG